MSIPPRVPPDNEVIYRPWITRNGKRIYRPNGGMWKIVLRNGRKR